MIVPASSNEKYLKKTPIGEQDAFLSKEVIADSKQITMPTSQVFPLARICSTCKER